jgi:hypothetical protein
LTQAFGRTDERTDCRKLEPLNDGLPESFGFGTPRFLGKINVKSLIFSALAFVATNAAAQMADVEGSMKRAPEIDKTWFLTWSVF